MNQLSLLLDRELKHDILASQFLVSTLEGLHLPFCAVPVLGVKVDLHEMQDI